MRHKKNKPLWKILDGKIGEPLVCPQIFLGCQLRILEYYLVDV